MQVRPPRQRRRGGRATDKRLRRGRLAEVVDAGVVGVAVIVFHVGEGGWIGGDVARVDLGVTGIVAERQEGEEAVTHGDDTNTCILHFRVSLSL